MCQGYFLYVDICCVCMNWNVSRSISISISIYFYFYLSIFQSISVGLSFLNFVYIYISLSRSLSLHISSFACLFVFQVIPFALWHQYKQQAPVRCTICFSKKQENGKGSRYNTYVKDPSFYRHVQPAVSFNGFFLRGSVLGTL